MDPRREYLVKPNAVAYMPTWTIETFRYHMLTDLFLGMCECRRKTKLNQAWGVCWHQRPAWDGPWWNAWGPQISKFRLHPWKNQITLLLQSWTAIGCLRKKCDRIVISQGVMKSDRFTFQFNCTCYCDEVAAGAYEGMVLFLEITTLNLRRLYFVSHLRWLPRVHTFSYSTRGSIAKLLYKCWSIE